MVYDTDVHIPGQVEQLIPMINNYLATGDIKYKNMASRILDTIIKFQKELVFKTGIDEYSEQFEKESNDIKDNGLKKLRNIKLYDEGIKIMYEDNSKINELDFNYWETLRDYVIEYFKKTGESVVNPGMSDSVSDVVDVEDEIDRRIRR